ncbi:MAG: hypothetical protein M9928_21795 [Anaerolineae bacterium]|nr:hypothetical protein [Anaerolineae bacterium]
MKGKIRNKELSVNADILSGTFYSVIEESGRVVALQIPEKADALEIAQLPELLQLRYEWASIINALARSVDGTDSNSRDYAQDMIEMVVPYL